MDAPHYAGFWPRAAAVVLDVLILTAVIALPLTMIYGLHYWTGDTIIHGFWDVLLNYIFPFVATIFFWLKFLATPGKMLLGLQVVDAKTGAPLSLKQAIGRYFAYLASTIPLLFGFIWIAFDKQKQGFHDKLSSSIVIHAPRADSTGDDL